MSVCVYLVLVYCYESQTGCVDAFGMLERVLER